LWLLVPAGVLSALLPAPIAAPAATLVSMKRTLGATIFRAPMATWHSGANDPTASALTMVWMCGAVFLAVALSYRQWRFSRSLAPLQQDADGQYRCGSIKAPVVVGVWRPRLVVPVAFEAQFQPAERALVLAHEQAHLARGDVRVRAMGMFVLCLCWFNPLVYWALGRLRFDQELACDAVALARGGSSPRRYAEVLLKSQLMAEGMWPLPVYCSWQSAHPIKTRIALMARPLPGRARWLAGVAVALGVSGLASFAVWAAQPESPLFGAPIAMHLDWSIDEASGSEVLTKTLMTTQITVRSGKEFQVPAPGQPHSARCTAFLHGEGANAEMLKKIRDQGATLAGMVLLSCQVHSRGKYFPQIPMSILMRDSAGLAKEDPATMEVGFGEPKMVLRMTFVASSAVRD
jgi:beta-lactamase regulating signal transducer with metallopeptidase domain